MDNNIKELMEKMKTDPAFAEKVNEIETKYPEMTAEKKEALLSLAKEETTEEGLLRETGRIWKGNYWNKVKEGQKNCLLARKVR